MTADEATEVERNRPDAERFLAGAVRRILKFLIVVTFILLAPVGWRFGMAATLGWLAGGLLSWLNFRALARSVEGLASRIVGPPSRARGQAVVIRFLLRYVLVAGVAYAIFRASSEAFRGFLVGLCLPVAGLLTEAAYEAYMALRRGY
jgi:hypothetical protein